MSASNTWPEPETVLSRLEQRRLLPLRSHPDLWLDDAAPAHRFLGEVPVRIVVTSPVDGCDQRESRIYPGGEIDRTHPTAYDATSRCAPGPALNIYPRQQRSLFWRVARILKGA